MDASQGVPIGLGKCFTEGVDRILDGSCRGVEMQPICQTVCFGLQVLLKDGADVSLTCRRGAQAHVLQPFAVELQKQWVCELRRKQWHPRLFEAEGVEEPLGRLQLVTGKSLMMNLDNTRKAGGRKHDVPVG